MSKEKQERANVLDPNRHRISKGMSVMPGGPENNNPDAVLQSSSQPVTGVSIYNDFSQQYDQMGTAMLNPENVKPSGMPGLQQMDNLPINMQEQVEGNRYLEEAQKRGLNGNPFIGMIGSEAVMPGAMPPDLPNNVPFGPTTTGSIDGGEMVPGSTPQKLNQPNKKGKK